MWKSEKKLNILYRGGEEGEDGNEQTILAKLSLRGVESQLDFDQYVSNRGFENYENIADSSKQYYSDPGSAKYFIEFTIETKDENIINYINKQLNLIHSDHSTGEIRGIYQIKIGQEGDPHTHWIIVPSSSKRRLSSKTYRKIKENIGRFLYYTVSEEAYGIQIGFILITTNKDGVVSSPDTG